MKYFKYFLLLAIPIVGISATVQWYSQQPAATVLQDTMVIAVEKASPQGYQKTTLASLKDYTLNNLQVTNYTIYSTNFWISNSYVSNYVVTNVYNDTYASNFFLTQNYVTNQYATNVTITNWYAPDTYISNFFDTNIYVNDTYVSNYFTTNLYYTTQTNVFNYLYVSNAYVTNITAKNLNVQNIYADNGVFTNGVTNLTLTPNTIVQADANRALASVPNGTGALTNDGSGNFGWGALSAGGDQVWTNDAGIIANFINPASTTNGTTLLSLRNQGTNVIDFGAAGTIRIGRSADVYEGMDDDRDALVVVRDLAAGDSVADAALVVDFASVSDATTFDYNAEATFQLAQSGVSTFSLYYSNPLTDNPHYNQSFSLSVGPNTWLQISATEADDTTPINFQPTYTSGTAYHLGTMYQMTNGNLFELANATTNQFTVSLAGVVTANAYVATEYAWSGATNQLGIGEFTYTAYTPCAVTNLTTTGSALLSITNASSSNITFTAYSPIRIPYGETSRSYTITNGHVFFGSFRKGTHGSAFVPRGFWQP